MTRPVFADIAIKAGLDQLDSVTYLALAVAFTGALIAIAIYYGLKSNRKS